MAHTKTTDRSRRIHSFASHQRQLATTTMTTSKDSSGGKRQYQAPALVQSATQRCEVDPPNRRQTDVVNVYNVY